ncbi:MAG: HEAT repeat domain-containing protein [Planctomycetes bacterium]|nr:HEAT repeat domain-containing protein [Planctomycetota bacterium]
MSRGTTLEPLRVRRAASSAEGINQRAAGKGDPMSSSQPSVGVSPPHYQVQLRLVVFPSGPPEQRIVWRTTAWNELKRLEPQALSALVPGGSLIIDADAVGLAVTENTEFETSWMERKFEDLGEDRSRKRCEKLLREVEAGCEEIQEVDVLFLRFFALEHTQDANWPRAEALVRTLGLAGEKVASHRPLVVRTLPLFLGHPCPEVRIAVVESLWNIGTTEATEYIRIALRDGNEWVRRSAETALGGS